MVPEEEVPTPALPFFGVIALAGRARNRRPAPDATKLRAARAEDRPHRGTLLPADPRRVNTADGTPRVRRLSDPAGAGVGPLRRGNSFKEQLVALTVEVQ